MRILISAVVALLANSLYGQDSLLHYLSMNDGAATYKFRELIKDDSGDETAIPVAVIHGGTSGPVVTIIAGVHGYEYPPIIAAQELIYEVDPSKLSGTVIIIPMANVSAFYGRSPFVNPVDDLNLNRVFPGSEHGSVTERIAHYFTTTVFAQSDVIIDMHGGDANEDLLPFICYYDHQGRAEQTAEARRLCESSGFEYVVSYGYTLSDDEPAHYAFKQAVQDGKVALSIESGKLGMVTAQDIDLIKNGIYNMLDALDLYPAGHIGSVEPQILSQQSYLRSGWRGVFHSDLVAGDQVSQGDTVGYVTDDFGVMKAELIAPADGIILYKIGTPPVNPGETIMCIANE